jgi:hypothetical protein
MKRLKYIKKINYQEIPSVMTNDDGEFYISRGLHVILHYDNDRARKLFISDSYRTNIKDYSISTVIYSNHDLIAFHVYRYLQERCNFSEQNWRVLWKLLRYSNSFINCIKKFYDLLKKFSQK